MQSVLSVFGKPINASSEFIKSAINRLRIIQFYGNFLSNGEHILKRIKNEHAMNDMAAGMIWTAMIIFSSLFNESVIDLLIDWLINYINKENYKRIEEINNKGWI